MALENAPPYLIELARSTDPEVLRRFVATGEGLAPGDGQRLAELLGEWLADGDYWQSLAQSQQAQSRQGMNGQVVPTEQILDEELEILTQTLGDELAQAVLLLLPDQVTLQPVNPVSIQQNIIVIQQTIVKVQVVPAEPAKKRLRVGRKLWRVFKAAAGGLVIAGDIVGGLSSPAAGPAAPVVIFVAAGSVAGGAVLIGEAAKPELAG